MEKNLSKFPLLSGQLLYLEVSLCTLSPLCQCFPLHGTNYVGREPGEGICSNNPDKRPSLASNNSDVILGGCKSDIQ